MLKNSPFYAGFAVDDLAAAKTFYAETLGVFDVQDIGSGLASLRAANGYSVLIYAKPGHVPAAHTILSRCGPQATGNFYIDEDVLAQDGVTDLTRYAVKPGAPLLPDIFLD